MDITQIEGKIRGLIEKCQRLDSENKELKTAYTKLSYDFQNLEKKKDQAVTTVERIIGQLKSLEETAS